MFLTFLAVLMLVGTLPIVLFAGGEMVGLTGLTGCVRQVVHLQIHG